MPTDNCIPLSVMVHYIKIFSRYSNTEFPEGVQLDSGHSTNQYLHDDEAAALPHQCTGWVVGFGEFR